MIRVVWTDAALHDVAEHTGYITDFNPRAAVKLALELRTVAASLALLPERGRPGLVATTRELVVVWPYILVYRFDHEIVEIVRVWHGSQDR